MKKTILYSAIAFVILYLLTAFVCSDMDFRMREIWVRLIIDVSWIGIVVWLIKGYWHDVDFTVTKRNRFRSWL